MTAQKPENFLKRTKALEEAMKKSKGKAVMVGLPSEKIGGEIYGDGNTVLTVGAAHEYGTPRRSFLRTPFLINKKRINKFIGLQFEKVAQGKGVDEALDIIGAFCRNISVEAFRNKGYGQWKELEEETVRRKGSSRILIDTGTLRNAITWVVRND